MFEAKYPRDAKNIQIGEFGFQGDVVIKKIEFVDEFKQMKKQNDGILALGESSGHMHKLFGDFELRTRIINANFPDDMQFEEMYFSVDSEAILRHQEHSPIIIGPGFYKVEIQNEYNYFQKRSLDVFG